MVEEKYRKLFELPYPEFLTVLEEVTSEQLDYQTIVGFLGSMYEFIIQDKAQMLLLTHFPNRLNYETIQGFLERSPNLDVRDEARKILKKRLEQRKRLRIDAQFALELFFS